MNKGVWGSKQFAFRGLITCGQCGAMFTAQEKFKKLKTVNTIDMYTTAAQNGLTRIAKRNT